MIINKDIMYIFCEVINQLEPDRILDAGMFFDSVGSVSRQILNIEVSDKIYITGLQTEANSGLNIYNKIYNEIVCQKDWYSENKTYDLAILLSDLISDDEKKALLESISLKTRYILMYDRDVAYLQCDYNYIELGFDDVKCKLVIIP